jgi:hypothetical protein
MKIGYPKLCAKSEYCPYSTAILDVNPHFCWWTKVKPHYICRQPWEISLERLQKNLRICHNLLLFWTVRTCHNFKPWNARNLNLSLSDISTIYEQVGCTTTVFLFHSSPTSGSTCQVTLCKYLAARATNSWAIQNIPVRVIKIILLMTIVAHNANSPNSRMQGWDRCIFHGYIYS